MGLDMGPFSATFYRRRRRTAAMRSRAAAGLPYLVHSLRRGRAKPVNGPLPSLRSACSLYPCGKLVAFLWCCWCLIRFWWFWQASVFVVWSDQSHWQGPRWSIAVPGVILSVLFLAIYFKKKTFFMMVVYIYIWFLEMIFADMIVLHFYD